MIFRNIIIYSTFIIAICGYLSLHNSYAIDWKADRFQDKNNCIASTTDIDDDGLPNEWEKNGIDINKDGIIDLDLPGMGASPSHKDLFLEIDYMQNHKPYPKVDDLVIEAFKNSPQCNPDGISGTNLHIEIDDQIPEKLSLDLINDKGRTFEEVSHFTDLYLIKKDYFGSKDERMDPNRENILDAKEMVFKYALFIHTWNNQANSGVAKDVPAWDFVVSLGAENWAMNSLHHNTGTLTDQATTLMHELGHTINLEHGGKGSINDKPNYISRMNYAFQLEPILPDIPLDYSRCELNSLNENSLNEAVGLNTSCPPGLVSYFYAKCPTMFNPRGTVQPINTGGSVNWNLDPDNNIDKDLQRNLNCDISPRSKIPLPLYSMLEPYDDWKNVIYSPVSSNMSSFTGSTNLDTNINTTDLSSNNTGNVSNNVTKEKMQTILSLIDEPTPRDLQNRALEKLAGIKLYLNSIKNSSSLQIPTVDVEGNLIEETNEALSEDRDDPVALTREYYNMVIGDPGAPSSFDSAEESFADDDTQDSIANSINQGNIDLAIQQLQNNIIGTADSSFGGSNLDDFITDPIDQQKLNQLVTNLLSYLSARSCTYDECTYD